MESNEGLPNGEEDDRRRRMDRARQMGMAFADLDRIVIEPETKNLIPLELAKDLRALPVKRDGNTLWVVMDEPNSLAESKIKDATGLRVIPVMCMPEALDRELDSDDIEPIPMGFSFFKRNANPGDPPEPTAEEKFAAEERDRMKAEAMKRGTAFADLSRVQIEPSTLALIPPAIIVEHCIIPVKLDGKTLWLATSSLDNEPSIELVRQITGFRVIPVLCTQSDLDNIARGL